MRTSKMCVTAMNAIGNYMYYIVEYTFLSSPLYICHLTVKKWGLSILEIIQLFLWLFNI